MLSLKFPDKYPDGKETLLRRVGVSAFTAKMFATTRFSARFLLFIPKSLSRAFALDSVKIPTSCHPPRKHQRSIQSALPSSPHSQRNTPASFPIGKYRLQLHCGGRYFPEREIWLAMTSIRSSQQLGEALRAACKQFGLT